MSVDTVYFGNKYDTILLITLLALAVYLSAIKETVLAIGILAIVIFTNGVEK